MATTIDSTVSLSNAQEAADWLKTALPQYQSTVRMGKVIIVGTGMATGIGIVPKGPNRARLNWQFPSMGVQMLLTLAIVFTGILPGLVAFLIVWLSVKSDVQKIERDITAALASGAPPQG
ncbi:hypothetical protein [Enhygromyxa salina]|uniref:Uncharacterized protein n=1 Tax=Enhygromyxa salina TaxID=215803 RepID=A0A2S9YJF7_9BACT|nr:hypothetical protein [Enhygromyxa salina]PRQ05234.1 hypothetical protein ENSA7_46840 [Enhygromyxa salina]